MACNTINKETYSPEKVERLKGMIELCKRDYSIYIEDMKIIDRTRDMSKFLEFEPFVQIGETRKIKIVVYHGEDGKSGDIFEFYFGEVPQNTKTESLSGTEVVSNEPSADVKANDQKWEMKLLKEKLESAQKELKESEDWIALLESQVKEYESNSLVREIGSTVMALVKSNPAVLSSIPLLSGLAGAPPPPPQPEEETPASFSKKEQTNEKVDPYVEFIRRLRKGFSDQQFIAVIDILNKLSTNTSAIPTVSDLLDNPSSSSTT